MTRSCFVIRKVFFSTKAILQASIYTGLISIYCGSRKKTGCYYCCCRCSCYYYLLSHGVLLRFVIASTDRLLNWLDGQLNALQITGFIRLGLDTSGRQAVLVKVHSSLPVAKNIKNNQNLAILWANIVNKN